MSMTLLWNTPWDDRRTSVLGFTVTTRVALVTYIASLAPSQENPISSSKLIEERAPLSWLGMSRPPHHVHMRTKAILTGHLPKGRNRDNFLTCSASMVSILCADRLSIEVVGCLWLVVDGGCRRDVEAEI